MAVSFPDQETTYENMKTYSYGRQSINKKDVDAVVSTLRSYFLTQGPKVAEFEAKLCHVTGAKYAVAVSSGTAALHLAVLALGIKRGDQGITTPMTFVASANCLRYVGADVQFADINSSTGLIDPTEINKKITKKTKVLIPVHYAGQSCNMEAIAKIAKKHSLFVIEDAAHAIGSLYNGHPVGSCYYSDLTTFSFHPVKTITTGEGGAITTNNFALYQQLLMFRTHGIIQKPEIAPWYYEMHGLGYNYRLPDILASLGLSQLSKLQHFIARRSQIVKKYRQAFAGDSRFTVLQESSQSRSAFHLFPLLLNLKEIKKDKKQIFADLLNKGIKLQGHYIPVHLQPYYRELGFKPGDFPIAEAFYTQEISLPLYPSLTQLDVKNIIKIIKNTVK